MTAQLDGRDVDAGVFQLVRPDGRPTADLTDHGVDAATCAALHRDLVISRRIDTEAIALQRQGELAMWPSMRGQEGAQVGVAYALADQDMVFPTYREHAVAWCRGVDVVEMLGLFRGTTLGGWDPRPHRFNVYTLVIGAQTLHACGYAMGVVRDGAYGTGDPRTDTAVVAFLGDGALSEGETNEALVWAAAMQLPIVFVVQNNQWAISAPFSVQSRVPAAQRADGFGMRSVRVDGNDAVACLVTVRQALRDARAGEGPTLIEAVTYRMNAHTTADDTSRYRSAQDEEVWRDRDPIDRLGRLLAAGDDAFAAAEAQTGVLADAVAERMRAGCRQLAEPDLADSFRHTYAEIPPELERQLEAARAWPGEDGGER